MICQADDCTHYGCELRRKGVSIASKAIPNRLSNTKRIPPRRANTSYEQGIKVDPRPDGTVMPVLMSGSLSPMPIHTYNNQHRAVDAALRKAHGGN